MHISLCSGLRNCTSPSHSHARILLLTCQLDHDCLRMLKDYGLPSKYSIDATCYNNSNDALYLFSGLIINLTCVPFDFDGVAHL